MVWSLEPASDGGFGHGLVVGGSGSSAEGPQRAGRLPPPGRGAAPARRPPGRSASPAPPRPRRARRRRSRRRAGRGAPRSAQPELVEARALGLAGGSTLIGTPWNTRLVGRGEPDRPVAAVLGAAEDRVDARPGERHGVLDQRRGDLRGVHPDQERAVPRRANAPARRSSRPPSRCGDHLEAGGQPRAGLAVEHHHAAPRRVDGRHRVERVARAPPRRAACLLRRARRGEPGLRAGPAAAPWR